MKTRAQNALSIALSTLSLALATATFGCSSGGTTTGGANNAGTSTTPDGGAGSSGASGVSGDSCAAIAACVGTCTDTDTACQNACLAAGTQTAQTDYNAIVSCAKEQGCTDSACLQAKCVAQITTCANDTSGSATGGASGSSGSTGSSSGGATGSVPANFVGTWASNGLDTFDDFAFKADGTGSYTAGVLLAGCSGAYDYIVQTGSVTITDSAITLTATSASYVENICGDPSTTPTSLASFQGSYTYDTASDTLTVVFANDGTTHKFTRGAATGGT